MIFRHVFFTQQFVLWEGKPPPQDGIVTAVASPVFELHAVILFEYLIPAARGRRNPPFAAEMRIGKENVQLIGIGRIVPQPQVTIRVDTGCAAAERLHTVCVRKNIKAVPVALGNRERRVERHPVNQIGELAQSAADSRMESPTEKHQPRKVSFSRGGLADEPPKGEGFARSYENTVQLCSGKAEIGNLVDLKLHIHIAQLPQERRGVCRVKMGKRCLIAIAGKAVSAKTPEHPPHKGIICTTGGKAQSRPLDGAKIRCGRHRRLPLFMDIETFSSIAPRFRKHKSKLRRARAGTRIPVNTGAENAIWR